MIFGAFILMPTENRNPQEESERQTPCPTSGSKNRPFSMGRKKGSPASGLLQERRLKVEVAALMVPGRGQEKDPAG
jgi:hypothetical protein